MISDGGPKTTLPEQEGGVEPLPSTKTKSAPHKREGGTQ